MRLDEIGAFGTGGEEGTVCCIKIALVAATIAAWTSLTVGESRSFTGDVGSFLVILIFFALPLGLGGSGCMGGGLAAIASSSSCEGTVLCRTKMRRSGGCGLLCSRY